jgi:phenylpropionate dioxygenase-like ring-hydroxylating dioxygenase large terminal subunit
VDAIERELLASSWLPVARMQDLDTGPQAARILGTELVVYRGEGGLTVAEGYCPHRGAMLSMGCLVEGQLECPYHGWRFEGGSGRLTNIPSLPAHLPPMKLSLKTYPVREAYGHVWTSLQEPYLPFPRLAGTETGEWSFMYGEPVTMHCGPRQLTENFRDMSHFPFVHRGSMGPNVRREVDEYEVHRDGWGTYWVVGADLGGTAFEGNRKVSAAQTLTYRLVLPLFTSVHTRFPDGGQRITAQFVTPETEAGEWCRQYWLTGIDSIVINEHGVSLEETFRYEDLIFEEDRPIANNQMPRETPLELNAQVHTRADRFSVSYRKLYVELLEAFARDRGLPTDGRVAKSATAAERS